MFYYLTGTVSELFPNLAVIDCGGIGFAVNTSAYSVSSLQKGESAKLYTYLNIREDAMDLFGFSSLLEKHCFEMLLGVSGVGPKAALAILSVNSPDGLMAAIVSENEKALTAAQGIGKRIAQRIILELKDKIAKESSGIDLTFPVKPTAVVSNLAVEEAAKALRVLGYSSGEIERAIGSIDVAGLKVEDIIRSCLKVMSK